MTVYCFELPELFSRLRRNTDKFTCRIQNAMRNIGRQLPVRNQQLLLFSQAKCAVFFEMHMYNAVAAPLQGCDGNFQPVFCVWHEPNVM